MKFIPCFAVAVLQCSIHIGLGSLVEPVSVQWPLPDTIAYVGKLFQFHIPSDTFHGSIQTYQVFEQSKGVLPDWLHFDVKSHLLSGIPLAKNKGHHLIEVTVIGVASPDNRATDVITISVYEDPPHISSRKQKAKYLGLNAQPVNCQEWKPLTSVTIAIDTDFDQFNPAERIAFAKRVAQHVNLAPETLKFNPVSGRPTFDGDALVAGAGDVKLSKYGGVFASWLVGCGSVENEHIQILQQIEKHASDGTMARDVQHPVIGWHVSNSDNSRKRIRRDIQATPSVSIPPPTDVINTVVMTKATLIRPSATVSVRPTALPDSASTKKPIHKGIICPNDGIDRPPIVNNRWDFITLKVGEYTKVPLPDDVFDDCEGKEQLTYEIVGKSMMDLPNWASFDTNTNILKFLPLTTDIGEVEFLVVARDAKKQTEKFSLKVTVATNNKILDPSIEFATVLDFDYKKFVSKLKYRLSLKRKLGSLFNDKKGSSIVLLWIKKGSTIVGWTFTEDVISRNTCEKEKLQNIVQKILNKNATVRQDVSNLLADFNIKDVSFTTGGKCKGISLGSRDDHEENVYVTTVVPAIVVVVILLIAFLVACILYRKRRQGRMSTKDQTCVEKGPPAVLLNEMESKDNYKPTDPLVKNERAECPPAPPEYNPAENHRYEGTPERQDNLEESTNRETDFLIKKPNPPVGEPNAGKQPASALQQPLSSRSVEA